MGGGEKVITFLKGNYYLEKVITFWYNILYDEYTRTIKADFDGS